MPIDNLGQIHFDEQQLKDIHESLNTVIQVVNSMSINLDPAERRKYGKVGEQNKLLINKVKDLRENQPKLSSPEVDWDEFEKDYHNRAQASQMLSKIRSIEIALMNIKILSDYDNYTDSLKDYQHAKYKSRFADQPGYLAKVDILKSFFPKTGKKSKKNKK